MNRTNLLSIFAATALALVLGPGTGVAQKKTLKEQLVGAWLGVSRRQHTPRRQQISELRS